MMYDKWDFDPEFKILVLIIIILIILGIIKVFELIF